MTDSSHKAPVAILAETPHAGYQPRPLRNHHRALVDGVAAEFDTDVVEGSAACCVAPAQILSRQLVEVTDVDEPGVEESTLFDRAAAPSAASLDSAIERRERVAAGSPDAVVSFVARVKRTTEFSGAYAGITGAALIAPSFSETALQAYLDLLAKSRNGSIRSALELLTHREGYLNTAHGGCHVLLVEESSGRRRPLMPQN